MAEFDGETDKGKFRRLDAHVVSPLLERGYIRVEEVGTQKRVFLTDDGRNTLRAFRYLLE
jgi:predicted transcriptional regulator